MDTALGYHAPIRRLEASAASSVDVLISGDINPARSRRIDRLMDRVHQNPPARPVRDLEVEDLDRHFRTLADRDCLVHGLHDLLPFTANVARVRAVVLRGGLR